MDQVLVSEGLAPSRSAAQRLISAHSVEIRARVPLGARPVGEREGWQTVLKPSVSLPPGWEVRLVDRSALRWASRAGLKLDAAWTHVAEHLPGKHALWTALDVGQSTGGFTDVLLDRGARHVVGVEVGHGQLIPRLREDPRVTVLEHVNARHLTRGQLGIACPDEGFDCIVGDLSFISQRLVWPALVPLLRPGGHLLTLVKPQFELQPEHIGRGGLVRSDAPVQALQQAFADAAAPLGLEPLAWFESALLGADGNREFFTLLRRALAPSAPIGNPAS